MVKLSSEERDDLRYAEAVIPIIKKICDGIVPDFVNEILNERGDAQSLVIRRAQYDGALHAFARLSQELDKVLTRVTK